MFRKQCTVLEAIYFSFFILHFSFYRFQLPKPKAGAPAGLLGSSGPIVSQPLVQTMCDCSISLTCMAGFVYARFMSSASLSDDYLLALDDIDAGCQL